MNLKWTLFTFSRGDFKAVERYLNEQAAKGWELERVGFLARWKRTERRDLKYCVDLAKPNQDRKERQDYVEFCREGGWELTAFPNQMYIFKSAPDREVIPIQTDPQMERKNYNRYYTKNVILSVLVPLLYIGFFFGIDVLMGGSYHGDDFAEFRFGWFDSWLAVCLIPALYLWALWAVWRLIDFIRAMASNRGGKIGVPPRWIMWGNAVVSLLAWIGAAVLLIGAFLENVFSARLRLELYFVLGIWAIVCMYRAIEIERDLFRGERRRTITVSVTMAVLLVVLIVGRVAAPCGQWDTNPFGGDEDAMEQYALLETLPVVRGEDIGMPLSEERTEYFYLTHEITPMGERWELANYYRGSGLDATGCETYAVPTARQAQRLVRLKLEELEWSAYIGNYSHNVGVAMTAAALPWADEAWYGERHFEDEMVSVLVVRVGKQVTYLSAPAPLMTEELLSVIEDRLCR